MNALTKLLLGGAAFGALASVPAVAVSAPAFHVTALHAGRVVNKTKLQVPDARHITYTLGVYTSVPASDLHKVVLLAGTFYRWSTDSECNTGNVPKQKIKAQKKSVFGRIHTTTESYSFGCGDGPTVFYGDTYTLTDKSGFGQSDRFVSILYGKWTDNKGNGKYKGTLYLDVSVAIGEE